MNAVQMPNKYSGLERAEVAAWLENPVTKRAMNLMDAKIQDARDGIINNITNMSTSGTDAIVGSFARASGIFLQAMDEVQRAIFDAAVEHVR